MSNGTNLTIGALALLAAAGAARRRGAGNRPQKQGTSTRQATRQGGLQQQVPLQQTRVAQRQGPTLGGVKGVWIGKAATALPPQIQRTRPVRNQTESDDWYNYRVRDWRNRMVDEHLGGHLFWIHAEDGMTRDCRDGEGHSVPVRVNNPELPVEYLRFMFDTLARSGWWQKTHPKSQSVKLQSTTKAGRPYTYHRMLYVTPERVAALPVAVMRKEGRLDKLPSPADVGLPTKEQIEDLIGKADLRDLSDSTHYMGYSDDKLQVNIKAHGAYAPSDVEDKLGWEWVSEVIWGMDGQSQASREQLQEWLKEHFDWVGDIEIAGRQGGYLVIDVNCDFAEDAEDIDWDDVKIRRTMRGARVSVSPETREEIASVWNRGQVFLDEIDQLKAHVEQHVRDFNEWISSEHFWAEDVANWEDTQGQE